MITQSPLLPVILVFAYKRPVHLKRTLDALAHNHLVALLPIRIYVDGPRQPSDEHLVHHVAHIASQSTSFASVEIIQRPKNLGLYNSLTSGITEAMQQYDSALVFEDDIYTSSYTIKYLIDGLEMYRTFDKVASIHAYTPPINSSLPETFFLRGADCWGWATWRDRWSHFRHDAFNMANEIKQANLIHEFNLKGNFNYYQMLCDRANGVNNSWAICWHASCFLSNKLTLHPGRSLVENIGLDFSGEHCGPSSLMASRFDHNPVTVDFILPAHNKSVFNLYCQHYSVSLSDKLKNVLLKLIRSFPIGSTLLRQLRPSKLDLSGQYSSYELASAACAGYSDSIILDKVHSAITSVLEMNGGYERDGTVFNQAPPNLMISRLLASILDTNDTVIDFGGGLGGTYINNRHILPSSLSYIVVEQPNFVKSGSLLSAKYDLPITFLETIDSISAIPKLVILSGVLQYIPDAFDVISRIIAISPDYIIIDRTSVGDSSMWSLQQHSTYYKIPLAYPHRPINLQTLFASLSGYKLIKKWHNEFDARSPQHLGMLFQRDPYVST